MKVQGIRCLKYSTFLHNIGRKLKSLDTEAKKYALSNAITTERIRRNIFKINKKKVVHII